MQQAQAVVRDGALYSPDFDDIYHSMEGAVEESRHVFVEGNSLVQRFRQSRGFTIVETGFGCGLNFLSTREALRQSGASCRLDYVSVEKHPFGRDDLAKVLDQWPQSSRFSAQLLRAYPSLVPGFHRLHFDDGRVTLTLLFGDALEMLEELDARADAFFLDGFAPAKNADMWSEAVFRQIGRLAAEGATAASYSVAAAARAGLALAGFSVSKQRGFARKREMLVGTRPGPREASRSRDKVVVVGAGVAGTACAFALARRGVEVTLLDRAQTVASAASSNPAAIVRPFVTLDRGVRNHFGWAAFLYAVRLYREMNGQTGFAWNESGVLQLARDTAQLHRLTLGIERNAFPAAVAQLVGAQQVNAIAGMPIDEPGAWYPGAGVVEGAALCRALLNNVSTWVRFRSHCDVRSLRIGPDSAQVLGANQEVLETGGTVILANGIGAGSLIPGAIPWLRAVRGQVTTVAPVAPQLRVPVCRDGYVTPVIGNQHFVGATYDESRADTNAMDEDRQTNLQRLARILPGVMNKAGQPRAITDWADARCTSPDRLPIAGQLAGRLFCCVAMGSRGFGWAPLLAECLASRLAGAPVPLERSNLKGLSAARFETDPKRSSRT
jgi:tRNA 5-methylaminomethyl-2-thiouridine biosynthesis bifunctional protein